MGAADSVNGRACEPNSAEAKPLNLEVALKDERDDALLCHRGLAFWMEDWPELGCRLLLKSPSHGRIFRSFLQSSPRGQIALFLIKRETPLYAPGVYGGTWVRPTLSPPGIFLVLFQPPGVRKPPPVEE